MTITLTIDSTDNAAFGETEEEARTECVRIMREGVKFIAGGYSDRPLLDVNGNKVGRLTVAD